MDKRDNATRHNAGKADLSLLPRIACEQEARVWMFGEDKYGRSNWKKLWGEDTYNVSVASLLRHAFAIADGELVDKESGLSHAAHIRCNAAMILEYQHRVKDSVQDAVSISEDGSELVDIDVPRTRRITGGDEAVFWVRETIHRRDLEWWQQRHPGTRLSVGGQND